MQSVHCGATYCVTVSIVRLPLCTRDFGSQLDCSILPNSVQVLFWFWSPKFQLVPGCLTFLREMLLLLFVVAAVTTVLLARRFSPHIYDTVIVHMTETWYLCVLKLVPVESRILDIGVGTASALLRHKTLIKDKRLQIVGVDYDVTYVKRAQKSVAAAGLAGNIRIIHASIFDKDILTRTGCPFDAAYFSGSFSLMPEPAQVRWKYWCLPPFLGYCEPYALAPQFDLVLDRRFRRPVRRW